VPVSGTDRALIGTAAATAGGGRHPDVERDTDEFGTNEAVALAIAADGRAVAVGERGASRRWGSDETIDAIAAIERTVGPRWVWWTADTARLLVAAGMRPARCWDIDAVHRLLHGGWKAGPARTWAAAHDLDTDDLPHIGPTDLFSAASDADADHDPDDPIRSDGHLDPGWVGGGWSDDVDRMQHWATLALDTQRLQTRQLELLTDRPAAGATARSESAAALLGTELEIDGLPIDLAEAERIIASSIGPRPRSATDEARLAAERDACVLDHLAPDLRAGVDLRNPASVKSLLRRAGIEVDDTRAWRLERLRDEHPVVDALLTWRKAERIATTFGYRWLDAYVGADDRLRGTWSASDGAAGRMTATAGLHNMPAELRPAIVAERGHVFVRADLGQIEPRILAAVSGDASLGAATLEADMYAPVAERLGVSREVAKVAVLGAMYGQTTGHGAAALRGLDAAYPVAMGFLAAAAHTAEAGDDLRTRGGRLVRMSSPPDATADERDLRSRAAARGRYGRNAMVQGAAAEFFKMWAVIVRAKLPEHSRIVLCLHDELLVHASESDAATVSRIVSDALDETAGRWLQLAWLTDVRFVADISVITRWSDAK
jgi:DNA polymerase-1